MRIDVITLFPDFFEKLRDHSIVGRAIGSGKVELKLHNLRDWAIDNYGSVDGRVYGGGPGMLLRVDVVAAAIKAVRETNKGKVLMMTPQGELYKQNKARELAKDEELIILAGHYEGFDERIREYVDEELSIGDYVLTGGEIAAEVIIDSVTRLLPGVLGDDKSSQEESFENNLLEYPQYTRPEEYEGKIVPEIVRSGNHEEIKKWKAEQARERTQTRREDLAN